MIPTPIAIFAQIELAGDELFVFARPIVCALALAAGELYEAVL